MQHHIQLQRNIFYVRNQNGFKAILKKWYAKHNTDVDSKWNHINAYPVYYPAIVHLCEQDYGGTLPVLSCDISDPESYKVLLMTRINLLSDVMSADKVERTTKDEDCKS